MTDFYVHNLDPIAFSLAGIVLPWYWLVYILGFFFVYFCCQWMINNHRPNLALTHNDLIDYLVLGWLGVIIGGRMFYILAYNPAYYFDSPSRMIEIWNGGMSFHGGLLGAMLAGLLLSFKKNQSPLVIIDLVITFVPIVLGFGRLANFINGELAGRPSTVPWAVIFPKFYDLQPRHPSQLYEAIGEGIILAAILFGSRKNLARPGFQLGLFLTGYGFVRFIVEFFRSPDQQIGLIWGILTLGQIFCFVMIALGCGFLLRVNTKSS